MIRTGTPAFPAAHALLATLGLLAAGCVNQTAVLAGYTKPPAAPTFRLVDNRAAFEHETHWLSMLITACSYGVRQYGDDATSPDRVTLLEQDLGSALGQTLAHQTLFLTHYVIDINDAAALRGGVYGHHPGLVSGVMKGMGARCSRTEMKGGWYSLDEITTPYSPVIVDVALTWDGRTYQAHAVYSPGKAISIGPQFPDTSAAIFAAIRKATQQLIAEMQKS